MLNSKKSYSHYSQFNVENSPFEILWENILFLRINPFFR